MEAPKLKSKAAKLETFRRMNIKSNAGAAYPAASVAPAVSEFPEDPIDAEVVKPDPPVIVNGKSLTKEDALTAPKYAATLRVIDQVTLDEANGYLKVIKSLAAKIGDTFDPQIAKAHDLHKSLLAEKKKFAAPLEDAEKIVKRTIAGYLAAEEIKRQEAEAARAKAEAEARAAAQTAVDKAEKLQAQGKDDKADAIINAAALSYDKAVEAAPIVPEAPRASGLSLTETWKFSIVDASLIPREYLVPDEIKIGRIVRAMKGETKIPGVRIYSEKSVSSRQF
jgi:ribosomal protein S17E